MITTPIIIAETLAIIILAIALAHDMIDLIDLDAIIAEATR